MHKVRSVTAAPGRLALVLTGGGARAAYQVGVLQALAQHFPHTGFQVLGQLMNAVFLDVMDDDALRLQRSNAFLRELPPGAAGGTASSIFSSCAPQWTSR